MKIRTFFLLLLGIAYQNISLAQLGSLNLVKLPPSPDAAALGRFVEMPVGYYTGVPNIQVPLYELDVKGLKIPISLSYHASGVRVKDIPGQVGTNWALNAGGIITRVPQGSPDDHFPFIENDPDDDVNSLVRKRVQKSYEQTSFGNEFLLEERLKMALSTPGVQTEWHRTQNPVYFERWDTEIDIYYFNFLGYQGKFTFTNDGKPLLLSNLDLKIEYNNRTYKITDGKGVEFYFDAIEQAHDVSSNLVYYAGGGRLYTSSWMLSKIVIPHSNQQVDFEYSSYDGIQLYRMEDYYNYPDAFNSKVVKLRYVHSFFPFVYQDNSFPECDVVGISTSGSTPPMISKFLFIKKISYGDVTINFQGTNNRTDFFRYKLDAIQVKSKDELIRNIELEYSYFNPNSPVNGNMKLKLDGVLINDQHYRFGYIESFQGKTLPLASTKGMDLWGYYNGEDGASGLPYFKAFADPLYSSNINLAGANSTDLNPDFRFGQIGALNSITYPTGGKTTFEYEGNEFSKTPFIVGDFDLVTDPHTQFRFDDRYTKEARISTGVTGLISDETEKEFLIRYDQTVSVSVSLGHNPYNTLQEYMTNIYNNWAEAQIHIEKFNTVNYTFENVRTYSVIPKDLIGQPNSQFAYDQVKYNGMITPVENISLQEGRYRVRMTVYGRSMLAMFKVVGLFSYLSAPGIYKAGGIRLKKMEFESINDPDKSMVKTYEYKKNGLSSGVLETPISNMAISSFIYAPVVGPPVPDHPDGGTDFQRQRQQACAFMEMNSHPLIPLGNALGAPMGYSLVTEKSPDNSRTEYHFTTGVGSDFTFDVFPSTPMHTRARVWIDNSWKRGLQKEVNTFKADNEMVKQVVTDYVFSDPSVTDRSISVYLEEVKLVPGGFSAYVNGYWGIEQYIIKSNQHVLKVREIVKDFSLGQSQDQEVSYSYHPSRKPHGYPVKITRVNSMNEKLATYLKYPQDYTVGDNPTDPAAISIKNLLTKHVVAPAIEEYTEKEDENGVKSVIAGQYVSFKQSQPFPETIYKLGLRKPASDFVPASISASSSTKDLRYRPTINFHRFDNYGNVTEQSRQNDVKEVLLWGYNNRYPVARVVGSNYEAVTGFINPAVLYDPQSEEQMQTELDKIRTGMASSGAQVSTITYKPLVGILSETDPAGKKTTYEYDNYGRLTLVRDQNGDIKKKLDYHYQAPAGSDPLWESTGVTRCKPCVHNDTYTIRVQQKEEVDKNPNSATWQLKRWVDLAEPGNCVDVPDWQTTSTPVRCKRNFLNTGEQERELQDMNPCSPTAYSKKWEVTEVNYDACPLDFPGITVSNTTNKSITINFRNDDRGVNHSQAIPANTSNYALGTLGNDLFEVTITPASYSTNYSITYKVKGSVQHNYSTVAFAGVHFDRPIQIEVSPTPPVSVTGTNFSGTHITLKFYNQGGGSPHILTLPSGGNVFPVGLVPAGTYNVEMIPSVTNPGSPNKYMIGGYTQTYYGAVLFNNVTLIDNCNIIVVK